MPSSPLVYPSILRTVTIVDTHPCYDHPKLHMRIEARPTGGMTMPKHRIFATSFASVYSLYVQKAERKSRTKEEIDQIICWLTGYSQAGLQRQIEQESDFETFFAQAPAIHPNC